MLNGINAVIFDMDGVIIDSEPLWRKAMVKGFSQFNLPVTEDDCRKSMGKRIGEVVRFWVNHFSVTSHSTTEIEKVIIDTLIHLIKEEGKAIDGVVALLDFCRKQNLKIGLATSSSEKLMTMVLNTLKLNDYFDVVVSAEHLKYAKPHPEVFLICAERLGVLPLNCIVIEDSVTGSIAAKAAQMLLIAVPDKETLHLDKFVIADYTFKTMLEVLAMFKNCA